MERPDLHVLMLAYFYPPLGGAGVQRSLKFSKYLPQFGCYPSVISSESGAYMNDPSLLAEVPSSGTIIRLPHTPIVTRLIKWRQRSDRGGQSSNQPSSGSAPVSSDSWRQAWRDTALKTIGALQYPDDKAAWGGQARRVAMELIRKNPVDLIFSTSPPISAHLAAMRIAKCANLPWVADFRDLWTSNPAYDMPAWRRSLDIRLEKKLLDSANGVITVSEHLASMLRVRRPSKNKDTVLAISNGYDEADFSHALPLPGKSEEFRVVHAGTFYGHQSPDEFLNGVERLFQLEPEARKRLRLRFVGNVGARFERTLREFKARHPQVLELTGYVEHPRAIAEMLAADALLLVIGGDAKLTEGVMTGKLFEYLRAGRPVLQVGAVNGEAARLLQNTGAGIAVAADDVAEIAAVISRWLAGAAPKPQPANAIIYERRAQTARLSEFMATVHERFHGRN